MTTVTFQDEGTRQALESILWTHAHVEVWEDGLYHDLRRTGIDGMRGDPDAAADVVDTIDMLNVLRRKVQGVREAAIGATISLDIPPARLAEVITYGVQAIQEDENFWEMPEDRRRRVLAIRDAASRILRALPAPAKAEA